MTMTVNKIRARRHVIVLLFYSGTCVVLAGTPILFTLNTSFPPSLPPYSRPYPQRPRV